MRQIKEIKRAFFIIAFNEIVVNARDQIVRLQGQKGENIIQVSNIKINFNDDGSITVLNDGNGIVIKEHEKDSGSVPASKLFPTVRECMGRKCNVDFQPAKIKLANALHT